MLPVVTVFAADKPSVFTDRGHMVSTALLASVSAQEFRDLSTHKISSDPIWSNRRKAAAHGGENKLLCARKVPRTWFTTRALSPWMCTPYPKNLLNTSLSPMIRARNSASLLVQSVVWVRGGPSDVECGSARGNPGPAGGGEVLYASSFEGARVKFWKGWELFGYAL